MTPVSPTTPRPAPPAAPPAGPQNAESPSIEEHREAVRNGEAGHVSSVVLARQRRAEKLEERAKGEGKKVDEPDEPTAAARRRSAPAKKDTGKSKN